MCAPHVRWRLTTDVNGVGGINGGRGFAASLSAYLIAARMSLVGKFPTAEPDARFEVSGKVRANDT